MATLAQGCHVRTWLLTDFLWAADIAGQKTAAAADVEEKAGEGAREEAGEEAEEEAGEGGKGQACRQEPVLKTL